LRHLNVNAGKSLLAFKRDQEEEQELSARCFAWVQTYAEKPKRRLFELFQPQGMQQNQQVEFLSDGGKDVRNVQLGVVSPNPRKFRHPNASSARSSPKSAATRR
jgi:hypothetical protein